jgi:hypothetical protein
VELSPSAIDLLRRLAKTWVSFRDSRPAPHLDELIAAHLVVSRGAGKGVAEFSANEHGHVPLRQLDHAAEAPSPYDSASYLEEVRAFVAAWSPGDGDRAGAFKQNLAYVIGVAFNEGVVAERTRWRAQVGEMVGEELLALVPDPPPRAVQGRSSR